VTITAEFTSFTSWVLDFPGRTQQVNGIPLTSTGVPVPPGPWGSTYFEGNTVTFNPGVTSLSFGYDPDTTDPANPLSFIQNAFRFKAPPVADVNKGDVFNLGEFEFTNGQWYYQTDVGFVLTSHSTDPELDNHTFIGTIRLLSNSTDGSDPEAEADFFSFLERPDLGSCRVYDQFSQPASNPGNVGTCALDGRIGSLIPTRLYSVDAGAFTDPSTTGPLADAAVPEPATLVLLASGLAALARRAK
jgi:hypothetical protein